MYSLVLALSWQKKWRKEDQSIQTEPVKTEPVKTGPLKTGPLKNASQNHNGFQIF